MKNKRINFSEEPDQKVHNSFNKKVNLKNREQLRKKLKVLLEKDPSSLHLLAKDSVRNSPRVASDLRKDQHNKSVLNKKRNSQVQKEVVAEPKQPKQSDATPKVNNKNQKDKKVSPPFKEKLKKKFTPSNDEPKKKFKPSKNESEVFVSARNSKTSSVSKIRKQKQVKWRSKIAEKVRKAEPQIKKKTEKDEKTDDKPTQNETKKQPELKSKSKAKRVSKKKLIPKKKIKIIKKTPKEKKNYITQYRGPLRPFSSESDVDMCPPRAECNILQLVKHSKKRKATSKKNVPRSRMGQLNENQSDAICDDDDDYFSDDYEYTSSDDFEEYDSNSDNDSHNSYFSGVCLNYDSASDPSYELPKNVPEDVYVASGTAVKHDLFNGSDLDFDSDTSSAQIIEIPSASEPLQAITYNLTPLNELPKSIGVKESYESDNSCPELIPINNKTHINEDSDSECFEYLSVSGSDPCTESPNFSDATDCPEELPKMRPEIFHADKTTNQNFDIAFFDTTTSPTRNDITGSPLERIVNSKGNASSYKVITTNNEIVSHETEVKVKPTKDKVRPGKPVPQKANNVENKVLPPIVENVVTKTSPATQISEKPLETPDIVPETPRNKSTIQTLFYNAINSNQVIVILKDPLYLYGTVKLKLLAGSLEIFGFNPKRNEMLEIFSPRGYSSIKIEPSSSYGLNAYINEKELLSLTPYFFRSDLEEIIVKFDPGRDAVVILERNDRSKKVNMLRKYMVEHLFPNMNSIQSDRPFYASEFLLRCILTPKTDKALIVDPRWARILVDSNSKVMVIGGKAVGKTTLVRFLINKNLNKYPKILLIDLDIGQPEMFVPQTVSATTLTAPLLGPGYLQTKDPDKAFLVGQVNVVLLPEKYIAAVQALLKFCNENAEYHSIPWIINTMGYNKGFGDELIAAICNFVHPTNIIQLESFKEINNFDVIMSKENLEFMECDILRDMFSSCEGYRPQHALTLISSVIPNNRKYQHEWDMKPRDMRLAMIVSRLSAILTGHAEWLTDIKPVCASIEDLKILNLGDDQVNSEDLVKTLVGNLIYLCRQEYGQTNECLGIGIVRGVDFALKQIYLLPAVPLKVLENVNCLAICGIPLPSSILINQGPKVKGVVSYIYNTIDEVASMYVKQIYNRPQHFLTGKRKSMVE